MVRLGGCAAGGERTVTAQLASARPNAPLDDRPGLHPTRLARLVDEAVARLRLDLRDAVVLTEAATGSYAVTPVIAARAGAARVYAMARETRFGSVEQVTAETLDLARLLGVDARIELVGQKQRSIVEAADIVTNSGHVRPIDEEMIGWMKPTAVIPLMYETWELRPGDLDVAACRRKGILIAGTNERHAGVDIFSFLGVMAVRLLHDAGVAVYESSVLVACDNGFGPFIQRGLEGAGAAVELVANIADAKASAVHDAILVAKTPRPHPIVSDDEARRIAAEWPGAVVAQYFGDLDRATLSALGVPVWPRLEPRAGHMGILPAEVGPEPTVRLQSGGLKAGEVLWRYRENPPPEAREYIDEFVGRD
jgi:hypothetical protein